MTNLQLACETAHHRTVTVNGVALHCLEWGDPSLPGLCLLHGSAAHAHWFDAVAPAFLDRFHVVAVDQRGHGESAWPVPPAYGTEDFVGDLVALFDALGWAAAVVVGHSMGGHNAITLAAWHPARVAGLVVLDARPAIPAERLHRMRAHGARPRRRHATRDAAVAAFRLIPADTLAAPALLTHMAEVGLVEHDGAWMYRFDPDCNRLRRPVDAWSVIHRITAPTLVVRGARSPILTREMAERVATGIAGARLAEIDDSYHHVTLDAPAALVRALEPFLAPLAR